MKKVCWCWLLSCFLFALRLAGERDIFSFDFSCDHRKLASLFRLYWNGFCFELRPIANYLKFDYELLRIVVGNVLLWYTHVYHWLKCKLFTVDIVNHSRFIEKNDSEMDMRKTNGFERITRNKFNMNIFLFEVIQQREKNFILIQVIARQSRLQTQLLHWSASTLYQIGRKAI